MKSLKLATRKSELAVWQAEYVKQQLNILYPEIQIELIKLSSKGDRLLNSSLAKIGGKGLFIKEIEQALIEKEADIAVHSMKDMPVHIEDNFIIGAVCQRANPFDAFISNKYKTWQKLPYGSVVGTSSLRRQSQILALREDLQVNFLRGNVNSRLAKLDEQQYDAIILACAGLQRINLQHRITQEFKSAELLPAVAQGVICLEIRKDDNNTYDLIRKLNHQQTALAITAERTLSKKLNASCTTPVAGFATIDNNTLSLQALVATPDGKKIIKTTKYGNINNATDIGKSAAEDLLRQGAEAILNCVARQ